VIIPRWRRDHQFLRPRFPTPKNHQILAEHERRARCTGVPWRYERKGSNQSTEHAKGKQQGVQGDYDHCRRAMVIRRAAE
jgi:hypothetical protein